MKVYLQAKNQFLYIPLPGPAVNPDGRRYAVLLLPSSYVAAVSYTDPSKALGQIMIEGAQGAMKAPGLPGGVGADLAREIFKVAVDQVVGIIKDQAIQALSDAANRDDIVNACGYYTNRTGSQLVMSAAVLCAFGGGKPLRYHNRVKAETNYNQPRFYIGRTTELSVSYGLPVPFIGGDAKVKVVGA